MTKILIVKTNVKRAKGRIYWLDQSMNICSKPMGSTQGLMIHARQVAERKPGYLYFLDRQGNVMASKMRRN